MRFAEVLGVHRRSEYHDSSLASVRVPDGIRRWWSGDRPLAIAAAYRAVQILVDMSAQLPWAAVRGGRHSDQAASAPPGVVDPAPQVLVDPSPDMGRDDVIRQIVGSLILRGRAHLHLQMLSADGYPRWATPVNPDEVTVRWNDARTRPEYRWRDQMMVDGVDMVTVDMIRPPGSPSGVGPIDAAMDTIRGVAETDGYARRLFTDSAVPSTVLKVPAKLTEAESDLLRGQWDAAHLGGRGTAVASGGIEPMTLTFTPEQAQFLATRAFGVQELARLFGLPEHFLNAGNAPGSSNTLTYTNVQGVFRELVVTTLYPTYLRRLESAFSRLIPRGQAVEFATADLLRADDQARYAALKTAVDAGIMTIDEARHQEGLPALTAGATT